MTRKNRWKTYQGRREGKNRMTIRKERDEGIGYRRRGYTNGEKTKKMMARRGLPVILCGFAALLPLLWLFGLELHLGFEWQVALVCWFGT